MKQSNVKEYFKPTNLKEALSLLNSYDKNIAILAGGTDLFTDDHSDIDAFLDIDLLGLDYIKIENNYIRIGSNTTFANILHNNEIYTNHGALWDASICLADKSVRNMATIGGNICSSVPSGDSIPPLFALSAIFIIETINGEKKVRPEEFFLGPRKNILKKGEILKEILLPRFDGLFGSAFTKIERGSVDLATANIAVFVRLDNEKISESAIALGAVAPTVVRASKLENALIGIVPNESKLSDIVELVEESISPISDIRSTATYRRKISNIIAKRTIISAYNRAIKNNIF